MSKMTIQLAPLCWTTALVLLLTGSCQSVPPGWGDLSSNFINIPENEDVGSFIGSYKCNNTMNGQLTLSYQPSYIIATPVMGSKTDFNLTTGRGFDYELGDRLFQLSATLEEAGNADNAKKDIRLTVLDVNDNYPVFVGVPYIANIREDSPPGFQVYTIAATDADAFTYIDYAISTADKNGRLSINSSTGIITLEESIDYELGKIIQLDINATDNDYPNAGRLRTNALRLTAKQVLIINIQDVQDVKPTFLDLPYITEIGEELPVGFTVLNIRAQDGDRGDARDVKYFLLEYGGLTNVSEDGYFSINENNGTISIASRIDRDIAYVRDRGGVFSLRVQAREVVREGDRKFDENLDAANIPVTITVTDIDDNKPKFNLRDISASVDENAQENLSIAFAVELSVEDPDNLENGTFILYLMKDGKEYNDLYVKPQRVRNESPVSIYVRNSSAFDYEKTTTIVFEVIAQSITQPAINDSTTIRLYVTNLNDNQPTFEEQNYEAEVSEYAQSNDFVITVTATDGDLGEYGVISYSLQGGAESFGIHSHNGTVYVRCACLDRERVDVYYLTVRATDGGKLFEAVPLIVRIRDENDNYPRFLRTIYNAVLKEGDDHFSEAVELQATDDDQKDTENSRITYSLSEQYGGNFSINPNSGTVSIIHPLDIEQFERKPGSVYLLLYITATDHGTPPLSVEAVLRILLEDVNDNQPYFTNLPETAKVAEDTMPGSEVYSVATKDDDFSEPNNLVNYRIESGSDKFQINMISGSVSLIANIDRELESTYTLSISATDRGTPAFNAMSNLIIEVTDVNDESPEFVEKIVTLNVFESATPGTIIGQLSATDKDLDSKLEYHILWDEALGYDVKGDLILNFQSSSKVLFSIDKNDGSISVSNKLDRETVSRVELTSTVEDMNAKQPGKIQKDKGSIIIHILDVEDTPPEFKQQLITAVVVRGSESRTILQLDGYVDVYDSERNLAFYFDNTYTSRGNVEAGQKLISVEKNGEVKALYTFNEADSGVIAFKAYVKNGADMVASTNIEVVIISSIHIYTLKIDKPKVEVEQNRDTLTGLFKTFGDIDLKIDRIEPVTDISCEVFVYVLPADSQEPWTSKQIEQRIDDSPVLKDQLVEWKVTTTSAQSQGNQKNEEFIIAIVMCSILLVVLVAVIIGFQISSNKLKFKLKAYEATGGDGNANSDAAATLPIRSYGSGNPLYHPNGPAMEFSQDIPEYRDVNNPQIYTHLDLLGNDKQVQAQPINNKAVLEALMTDWRGPDAHGPNAHSSKLNGTSSHLDNASSYNGTAKGVQGDPTSAYEMTDI